MWYLTCFMILPLGDGVWCRTLLEAHGFAVDFLSASNSLTAGFPSDKLKAARADPEKWKQLLALEREASASPGCLDMGTHLLAAGYKPADDRPTSTTATTTAAAATTAAATTLPSSL